MSAPTTIEDAIERNALGPAAVTVAGQTTTVKDIDQLIRADRYLAAKRVAASGIAGFGIRFQVIRPGGTG